MYKNKTNYFARKWQNYNADATHLFHQPTMGIEEEHFVVSEANNDLVNLTEPQFQHLAAKLGNKFSRELKACQIELRTNPATKADALYEDIMRSRGIAAKVLTEYGFKVFTGSTHPHGRWIEHPTRENERYNKIEERIGQAARRMLVSGLHIHIGTFKNCDTPIHRMAQFWATVPILIAANASSPIWEGQETGSASYRRNIILGLGSQCPPPVNSRAEYNAYIDQQVTMNAAIGESDIWLDIRPGRKGLGTVEVRAADIAEDAKSNVALASFMQGLEFAARVNPETLPLILDAETRHWLEQNCRLAAMHGLRAKIYDPYVQHSRKLTDFAADMLDIAYPGIVANGNSSWFSTIEKLICSPEQSRLHSQQHLLINAAT